MVLPSCGEYKPINQVALLSSNPTKSVAISSRRQAPALRSTSRSPLSSCLAKRNLNGTAPVAYASGEPLGLGGMGSGPAKSVARLLTSLAGETGRVRDKPRLVFCAFKPMLCNFRENGVLAQRPGSNLVERTLSAFSLSRGVSDAMELKPRLERKHDRAGTGIQAADHWPAN